MNADLHCLIKAKRLDPSVRELEPRVTLMKGSLFLNVVVALGFLGLSSCSPAPNEDFSAILPMQESLTLVSIDGERVSINGKAIGLEDVKSGLPNEEKLLIVVVRIANYPQESLVLRVIEQVGEVRSSRFERGLWTMVKYFHEEV